MLKRAITGTAITAVVYLVLLFSYLPLVLPVAVAVLCIFAVYELFRAAGLPSKGWMFWATQALAALAVLLPLPGYVQLVPVLFAVAVAVFAGLMIWQSRCRLNRPEEVVALALLVALLLRSVPELAAAPFGLHQLTFAITLCFLTDVMAYLVGMTLGRHKLIPRISPNKTVEGCLGGIAGALAGGLVMGKMFQQLAGLEVRWGVLALYAVAISITGQFGDLSMSVIKRIWGIKDFGKLLPGHGGMLDRFDSHIFAVALTLVLLRFTGGFLG